MELCSAIGPGTGGHRLWDPLAQLPSVLGVGAAALTTPGTRASKTLEAPLSRSSTGRCSAER
eukprot:7021793-Heterocapsa_arctica.AAC.1